MLFGEWWQRKKESPQHGDDGMLSILRENRERCSIQQGKSLYLERLKLKIGERLKVYLTAFNEFRSPIHGSWENLQSLCGIPVSIFEELWREREARILVLGTSCLDFHNLGFRNDGLESDSENELKMTI